MFFVLHDGRQVVRRVGESIHGYGCTLIIVTEAELIKVPLGKWEQYLREELMTRLMHKDDKILLVRDDGSVVQLAPEPPGRRADLVIIDDPEQETDPEVVDRFLAALNRRQWGKRHANPTIRIDKDKL